MDNKNEKNLDKKKKQQNDPSWHWAAPYLIYTVVWLFFIFLLKVMGAI